MTWARPGWSGIEPADGGWGFLEREIDQDAGRRFLEHPVTDFDH